MRMYVCTYVQYVCSPIEAQTMATVWLICLCAPGVWHCCRVPAWQEEEDDYPMLLPSALHNGPERLHQRPDSCVSRPLQGAHFGQLPRGIQGQPRLAAGNVWMFSVWMVSAHVSHWMCLCVWVKGGRGRKGSCQWRILFSTVLPKLHNNGNIKEQWLETTYDKPNCHFSCVRTYC